MARRKASTPHRGFRVADQIQREVSRAVHSPKLREMLAAQSLDIPKDASTKELRQKVATAMEQNRRIIDTLHLKLSSN